METTQPLVALKGDGTVVAWGWNDTGQPAEPRITVSVVHGITTVPRGSSGAEVVPG